MTQRKDSFVSPKIVFVFSPKNAKLKRARSIFVMLEQETKVDIGSSLKTYSSKNHLLLHDVHAKNKAGPMMQ